MLINHKRLIDIINFAVLNIGSFFLMFFPRYILEKITSKLLYKQYYKGFSKIVYFKSGRAALAALFESVMKKYPGEIVLLPDYLCNIVYKAANYVGIPTKTYKTNECFQPDFEDIERYLLEGNIAAVLFASMFGMQNNTVQILAKIRILAPSLIVIFDECQNLTTQSSLMPDFGTVVILSFNKTIHGVMGGSICFTGDPIDVVHPRSFGFRQIFLELLIFGMVFKNGLKFFNGFLERGLNGVLTYAIPKLEYSYGYNQYDVDVQAIAKLSLCRVIMGLAFIRRFENQRSMNYLVLADVFVSSGAGRLIETEKPEIALYIPVYLRSSHLFGYLPIKGPYATDYDSQVSIRPNIFCLINDSLLHIKKENNWDE